MLAMRMDTALASFRALLEKSIDEERGAGSTSVRRGTESTPAIEGLGFDSNMQGE